MFSQTQLENGYSSSQLTQSDSTPSPAKSRDHQGMVPVTVKQISQASPSSTDDNKSNFTIDGVSVTNVKLVGIVSDKTDKVTDVSFTLDDGTGRIGCKRWLNEAFDRKQAEMIEDGMYVWLVGLLKNSRGGNIEVFVFNMRPISDFNEFTFHYVDCIHQHALNNKLLKGDITQSQATELSQSTPIKVESNGYHSSPANQFSMQMNVDGLKDVDQRVLDFLQQSSSIAQDKGVHRDDIARHLKLPVEKIMESITCLEDEGLIYSTVDEFHFKSTAA